MTPNSTSRCFTPLVDEADLTLLELATSVLLECNVRASILKARIEKLGESLGRRTRPVVSYRRAVLHFDDGRCISVEVPEYRLNVFVSAGALRLLDDVRTRRVETSMAASQMESLVYAAPCYSRFLLAIIFGIAASSLACILHADLGAVAVSGVASAIGLLVRKEIGRRHWPVLSLPFVAAVVGGLAGGLAIALGWTRTPGLCLMVPALMLVPGPHLINGVYDILENHIEPGIGRLVLAIGVLLSAAAGTLIGAWCIMGTHRLEPATSDAIRLTLTLDVVLAGIAAAGFGAFYNTPRTMLLISIACGMIGHGVRFLCLAEGIGLPGATFLACVIIGLLAGVASRQLNLPFSSIAFAGAVPMMPGSLIYRSIAGALQLTTVDVATDPQLATTTLVWMLQALLVVGAMATGLLAGNLAGSFIKRLTHAWRGVQQRP